MRHLKLFSFILVLSILGSLPALGAETTYTFTSKSWAATNGGSAANWTSGKDGAGFSNNGIQVTTNATGANGTSPISFTNVTKVVCTYNTNKSKGAGTIDVQVGSNTSKSVEWKFSGSADGTSANFTATVDYSTPETGNVKITLNTTTNSIYLVSVTITTGSGSTPSLTLTPTSTSVEAANVANQSITLTTSNFSSSISSVTTALYSNAECTSAITSGQWVKDITVNAGKTAVTFNVEDNDGAQRQCWLKITATAGSQNASAILPITQAKYSAPTGTFKLFSGDIEEGDYVIYYSGKAMNTTVTSNRLQYLEVTPSDNKITDPDESIIWHIAPISETTYWSIYNDAEGKYAGGTSSKNQATMLSEVTTYAAWTITGNTTFEFENIGRSTSQTDINNKWLRNNGTNGFACYANGTGGALTLYKKHVDVSVEKPTFSPAAGSYLGAQNIELSCVTQGAEIYYTLDGSEPTSASTHYTGAIQVGTTMTIKAIAIKGDDESAIASATYTIVEVEHAGTEADPYSVADARTIIDVYGSAENVYVSGIVSEIVTAFNPTFGNISYNISADGLTTSDQIEAFRGKSYNGDNFTSADDIKEGDEVVVLGNLTKYNTTYEFAADNQLVSLVRTKAEAGLAYNVTAIDKNIGDAAFTNPLTNPNSLTVTYSSSDVDVATVDANGEVTVKGIGTTAIKASFAGNTSYLAQEVSYTLSVDDPSLTKVTFDATIDKTTENTELSLTKNGLTIAITSGDGRFNNSTDYRIYKNAVFTVSCASGNIKRIVFTCTSSNPITGFTDATGLDKEKNIWTGDATSIELTASNKQVQIPKLVVYYEVDTREEAGLEYADTDVEKHVGDAAFINTLTNPHSVAVTYESSDTDVAEVANDGTVTIKAEGTATITASFAGDATYKPAIVSYELTVEEAGLDKVTFDATIDYTADESTLTLSKGGFTLTFTGGAMNNKANYRLYKDKEMTLSSTDYLIKKIEFTCTSDNPITGFADATGLDKDNNQWTGETNTVELIASNKQVRIEKLVVHYVEDTRAASGLEWSTDAIVMMAGETFTPANLINPNNIAVSEITIESDNTDLATVSEGVVSLVENVIGNATITAKFAGNATYKPAEFSYTITVNDPTPLIITDPVSSLNFGSTPQDVAVEDKNIEVTLQNVAAATVTITGDGAAAFSASPMALTASGTIVVSANPANIGTFNATLTISDNAGAADNKEISLSLKVLDPADVETPISTASRWEVATASDIADGLEVLITGVKGDNAYAMGSQTNNNRTAIEASIDNEGVLTPGEGTMSFILVAQGEGKYALRTSNGKYLYAASSSSNHLKTREAINEDGKAVWAISVDDEKASIVANCETTNWRNVMQFNQNGTNPPMIACYATASQSPIKLYKKAPIAPAVVDVTGSEAASDIPEGSDVTVEDGGELVVNTTNSFAKLIVKKGGKVTLSNKKLTVTGTFAIETKMGSGKSGELSGVKPANFAVTGEAYIDITLGADGNADKWHAFTVPFPVDALNGIFDLNGNKLVNETNYAIMDYHGDIRAQGKYGWKKFRGTLVPGTFYLMTVDGNRTTYRMKMKAGSNVVAANSKAVTAYDGATTDKGWNGIGNPTLAYGQVGVAVQVLNPQSYTYETMAANSCNFIVGTPFFYQAAADGSIEMQSANASAYYAPIRKAVKTTEQIKVSLANENYTDNLFISASEDATNNYQIGKDLVKMTMTNTPIVPQIFGVAYKTQLSMVHAPLVGDRANYTLNLYAPADGEYIISAQQTEDAIVYLTYEGSPIWNITAGEYNCDLQKGNNSGFGLMLVRRASQVTTDIEGANQSQTGVRKLLINGQLFIEKDGKLFNVTGERL